MILIICLHQFEITENLFILSKLEIMKLSQLQTSNSVVGSIYLLSLLLYKYYINTYSKKNFTTTTFANK